MSADQMGRLPKPQAAGRPHSWVASPPLTRSRASPQDSYKKPTGPPQGRVRGGVATHWGLLRGSRKYFWANSSIVHGGRARPSSPQSTEPDLVGEPCRRAGARRACPPPGHLLFPSQSQLNTAPAESAQTPRAAPPAALLSPSGHTHHAQLTPAPDLLGYAPPLNPTLPRVGGPSYLIGLTWPLTT